MGKLWVARRKPDATYNGLLDFTLCNDRTIHFPMSKNGLERVRICNKPRNIAANSSHAESQNLSISFGMYNNRNMN